MLSNIIVAVMCVIAVAAGIFAWWMENGDSTDNSEKEKEELKTEIEKTQGRDKEK